MTDEIYPPPTTGSPPPVTLHHPFMSPTAAASNNASTAFTPVSDPSLRQMTDLRFAAKGRMQARIGGTVVAATKIRLQYHLGKNPAIASTDAGWTELYTSVGGHTLNQMFYSPEFDIPEIARVNDVLVRAGIFGGDGVADPTITCCILNLY